MRGKIIEKQRDVCDDTMDKKHDKKQHDRILMSG